jgi:hypothetical protein
MLQLGIDLRSLQRQRTEEKAARAKHLLAVSLSYGRVASGVGQLSIVISSYLLVHCPSQVCKALVWHSLFAHVSELDDVPLVRTELHGRLDTALHCCGSSIATS